MNGPDTSNRKVCEQCFTVYDSKICPECKNKNDPNNVGKSDIDAASWNAAIDKCLIANAKFGGSIEVDIAIRKLKK